NWRSWSTVPLSGTCGTSARGHTRVSAAPSGTARCRRPGPPRRPPFMGGPCQVGGEDGDGERGLEGGAVGAAGLGGGGVGAIDQVQGQEGGLGRVDDPVGRHGGFFVFGAFEELVLAPGGRGTGPRWPGAAVR